MANGQEIAKENIEKFNLWVATQTDDSYTKIIRGGQLNRVEIVKGAGIGRSALSQNPDVKRLLNILESELRSRKILPDLTPKAALASKQTKEYDHKQTGRLIDESKSSKLERENIELKAKVKELEAKIESLGACSELSETIYEMGMMPR